MTPLRIPGLSILKHLFLAFGALLSFYCIFLFRNAIWANFEFIAGYWFSILWRFNGTYCRGAVGKMAN